MDIAGKTIVVLGGWGLVGSAICRRLLLERPGRLIITSLKEEEARDAVRALRERYPRSETTLVPWWGNIFGRFDERVIAREDLLSDPEIRHRLIDDVLGDLSEEHLASSALYQLINEYRPAAVIDCINTATAIAYQDIYGSARGVQRALERHEKVQEQVERLLATLYIPQLIRHVQILNRGLRDVGAAAYVKIGTAGTGGMGLNIPYTHSEERPSRVLLSKSSVAGAHTLLLFLMARTPDGPVVKEIKPTATIAWKRIESGEVRRRGQAIPLVDPGEGIRLEGTLRQHDTDSSRPIGETLKAPFIDTGENGIFSRGEFEAITSLGQMEMITPEEIADAVLQELRGGNSGHDVIAGLDSTVYGPTYRGGYLRARALERLMRLETESGTPSVAFEMLGPPRLSKLLFEAHLLGLAVGSMRDLAASDPAAVATTVSSIVRTNRELRSRVVSIGIPVLMEDGVTLLRGPLMKIPPFHGDDELPIDPESIDSWAAAGWVDLRPENIERWKERVARIIDAVERAGLEDTSSRLDSTIADWENFDSMPAGKLAAWIFTVEEEGARMKA